MRLPWIALWTSLAVLAGCGPADVITADTLPGKAFHAQDSVWVNLAGPGAPPSSGGIGTELTLTDFAGACADARTSLLPKSSSILVLDLRDSSSAPIFTISKTGTYAVVHQGLVADGLSANVVYLAWDASCVTSNPFNGIGGTVTITAISSTTIQGTFSVQLQGFFDPTQAGTLTGSFTSSLCPGFSIVDSTRCM